MNECWPGRRTSFLSTGMCVELWSRHGERERLGVAVGKSACFEVEATVEIEGIRTGSNRSHVALRSFRVERSKNRTVTAASDCNFVSGANLDSEVALVFEKPGHYTLPVREITRIRSKHLHQGKASIEAKDSNFILSAASQIELERLLEAIREVRTAKVLGESRLCAVCKEKGERKKVKSKREQQSTVLECIFRKKQLPGLVETGEKYALLSDLFGRIDAEHASSESARMGMSPPEGSDTRPIEVDGEVCHSANVGNDGISAEPLKTPKGALRDSPVFTQARPASPERTPSFLTRTAMDVARRREAQRIVSERFKDIESGVSGRSTDGEKENVDSSTGQDSRPLGEETVKWLAEEKKGVDEMLKKVQDGQRKWNDESRRANERNVLEVEEKRRVELRDKSQKHRDTLRKLVELESKRKWEWESRKDEDRKRMEEEEKNRQTQEKFKMSLGRRLQEEDRRRKDEKKEQEAKNDQEQETKRLERILQDQETKRLERILQDQETKRLERILQDQETKRLERILQDQRSKRLEDERRARDLAQREEEERREREAQRVEEELKRREEERREKDAQREEQMLKQEDERREKEAENKLQEQMQAQMRKLGEEKLQEALNCFGLEEEGQEGEKEELKKFQDAVRSTIRLSQRCRSRVVTEEPRMRRDESRDVFEAERDKLDQKNLEDESENWRADEIHRRVRESAWAIPNYDRSNLDEQRRRVEAVMKMSKSLHRTFGEDGDIGRKMPATGDEGRSRASPQNTTLVDDDEIQTRGFHEKVAFLDQFLIFRDHQRSRMEDEIGFSKDGDRVNFKEYFSKPARSRQEDQKKEELLRKKAAKAASDLKKKLAQDRLKAAKLEAKRLEKLLKEAQKQAKAEERQRQHQKEQARRKAAASAAARGYRPSGLAVVHLTYQQYEQSWDLMKMSRRDVLLGYSDIPWPPEDNPLFVEVGDSLAAQRRKLRIALLRWHPDKFVSLCGNRLSPSERDCIEARAKSLAQEVIQWKTKLENTT